MTRAENFAGLKNLVAWFQSTKRPFPWRSSEKRVSSYAIWISEVMLQQTRAEVVIPYFQRFIHRFPDITSLAKASEEEVIKIWEGLGYYARARRLLQAARFLLLQHGGELPASPSLLAKIPGFGPYTVGAVASFAFHLKAAAVDGNVLRFLSRYLLIEKDIGKASIQEEFRKRVLAMLPDEEPWVAMEAMIELGATVCKKSPECPRCPLQETCQAFNKAVERTLPIKSPKKPLIRLMRKAIVVKCGEEVLITQVPPGRVMAGLYEFPMIEMESIDFFSGLNVTPELLMSFDDIRYTFTSYQVTLSADLWEITGRITWPEYIPKRLEKLASVQNQLFKSFGYTWVALPSLSQLPFSSGHRRLCQRVLDFLLTKLDTSREDAISYRPKHKPKRR